MNLNPGRGSFDLGHEQQSSPIRTRGYVDQNMAPSSSPPSIPVANNRPFPHGEGDNNIQTELDPTDEGPDESQPHTGDSNQMDCTMSDIDDSLGRPRPEDHLPPEEFDEKACRRQNGHFQQILREFERMRGYNINVFIQDCVHYEEVDNMSNTTRRRKLILSAISHPSTRLTLNETAERMRSNTRIYDSRIVGRETGKVVVRELRELKGQHPFGRWSSSLRETFEDINIADVVQNIKKNCPTWYSQILLVASNERSHWPSYTKKRDEPIQRLIYILTAMMMFQLASQRAGFASTQLGMFLRATGTKDRTIDVLSRFGICPTVLTLRKKEEDIKRLARHDLRRLARSKSPFVICYDNFDFTNSIRDQAMGTYPQLEHWTNAYGFTTSTLSPSPPLRQTQLRNQVHLAFNAVAKATLKIPEELSIWPQHLLYRGLDHAAKSAFRAMLRRNEIEFPRPSSINCLSPVPATVVHFAAIDANSGSTDGTYRVHQHIVESEMGWDTQDDELPFFKSGIQLICGDQKTVENIQTTKIDQQESVSLYDRRRWMVPTPGLFHIQMNLAGVMLRKHWSPIENRDGSFVDTRHALLRDIQFLGYKGLSPERSPWHTLDNVITVSFNARVTAVFLQCLERKKCIARNDINDLESLECLIEDRVSVIDFNEAIQMTEDILLSSYAAEGITPKSIEAVENAVQRLVDAVYEDEALRTKLQLKGSITFESHTNLGQTNQTSIPELMEQISTDEDNRDDSDRRTKRRRKEKGAASSQQQIQPSANMVRRARGKGNRADEFCVYRTSDGNNIPTVAIEYKAPHKLSRDELVTGLDTEIQPERDVINKEGDDFIFAAKSLSAAVITQLFSYMIGKGLQYGYICQGEVFVFLHIPDDPTIVYYSVAVPNLDVQESDENRLHLTAVAQVFAFVLNALLAKPLPQDWHHKADANLDTWDVEYIDILARIPETVRKFHSPSPYKPQKWQGFKRSPIRTRSRCMPFHNYGVEDTDDHDDNTPSATPSRSTGSNKTSAMSKGPDKESSAKKRGQSTKGGQQAQMINQTITTSPFCTQKCLLGLASGGTMDENCPNISDHGREHISVFRFLELIRAQLASSSGVDAGCQPLYLSGSRGSLFKIRLPSHGYTLVAKGVERIDHSLLQHEQQVYHRLSTIQGVHVPVCLGIVDLLRPYYYDCGVYTSFLLLGWAGKPLSGYINQSSKQNLQNKATAAFRALHELHVLHRDAAIRNIVYDKPNDNLMIVDFERAEIQHRQPLQPISTNYRKKRKWASNKLERSGSNGYEGEIGIIFQCFRRFG